MMSSPRTRTETRPSLEETPPPARGAEPPPDGGRPLAFGVEPSIRRYRLRLARYPALADTLAGFAREHPTGRALRLLDAGVGRGRTLRYLAPTGAAARFSAVGIDLDPRVRERVHDAARWRLLRADLDRPLPFRDAAFDVVVCEQVLEHLHDPHDALREMVRCLRPGGLLIVGVPVFPPGVAWLRTHLQGLRRADGHHTHVGTWTAGALERLLRSTGELDVRTVRGFRSASGGLLSPLEDLRWWWRLNVAFGRALPSLCAEVQAVAVRRA